MHSRAFSEHTLLINTYLENVCQNKDYERNRERDRARERDAERDKGPRERETQRDRERSPRVRQRERERGIFVRFLYEDTKHEIPLSVLFPLHRH